MIVDTSFTSTTAAYLNRIQLACCVSGPPTRVSSAELESKLLYSSLSPAQSLNIWAPSFHTSTPMKGSVSSSESSDECVAFWTLPMHSLTDIWL